MIKQLITLCAIALATSVYGQAPFSIFSDDIESGASNWTVTSSTTPNTWIFDVCAGNGSTIPGSNSMYVSSGPTNGVIAGCGATGTEQFNFSNSPSGTLNSIVSAQADAQCLETVEITFDYQFDGSSANDYCEFVYSLDNGITWTAVGAALSASTIWTSSTISLPSAVDGTIFDFGFRFTYDNTTVGGTPIAIDNIEITAIDNVAPAIICPAEVPLYVGNTCDVSLGDYASLAAPTDNCLNTLTVTQFPVAGTMLNITSSPAIILTVTDASGNQGQCSFNQTILDTIPPSINCPTHQTIYLDATCAAIVPDYLSGIIPTDNCESFAFPTLDQSPPAGSVIGASNVINITATDGAGNTRTCAFNLVASDTIAPTITCPSAVTVSTNTACDFTLIDYTNLALADDNCTPEPSMVYSQSPAAGTLMPLGTNVITIDVLDGSSISGSCTFDLIVEDQVNPIISLCPPNQNVIVDSNCEGLLGDYTTIVSTTDNCTAVGDLNITQSPVSGTPITANTLVTLTVADEVGNSTNCQFTALLSDTTPPTVNCPSSFNMPMNSSCQYTVPDITGMVTGTDNCTVFSNMTLTQSPTPGNTGSGTTNILITLFDDQGNLSTCITIIIPDDITPPIVTCPSDLSVNNGTNCDYTLPNYGSITTVIDDCPDYSTVQTPTIGTIVNPGTTPITIDITDAGGNTVTCSFTLTVIETESPTITCPTDISGCDPIVTYTDPAFSDNCIVALSQTDLTGFTSGDVFPVGITQLEYTAIDSSGNSSTCSFDIEVLDFPSQANILDDTLNLCDINTTVINAEAATSGSGLWSVISGNGAFNNQFANSTGVNTLAAGENIIEWSVSSAACGTTSDTLIINVLDSPLPANIASDTIYACELGSINLIANTPTSGSGYWTTDGNANITLPTSNTTIAIIDGAGYNQFTWTINNGSCPSSSDSVIVVTNRKPVINYQDSDLCSDENMVTIISENPDYNWLFSIGNGTIDINADTVSISNLSAGTNEIQLLSELDGCPTLSDTLILFVEVCDGYEPEIPTMFTPNYDGKNDLFLIDNIEVLFPECHVVIFNRWGSVIFESTGYQEPWDGTNKGEELPMGTYFYKIELNDTEGTIINGDISIIH